MYRITQEDVLAYVAGAVTHPGLRAAIEKARDLDPQVQYWFDLYSLDEEDQDLDEPDNGEQHVRVISPDVGPFVSEHTVHWAQMGLETPIKGPPTPQAAAPLPVQNIDTRTGILTLEYRAGDIPLGVARVEARSKGSTSLNASLGATLAVLRARLRSKDEPVRVGEVQLADLGITESVTEVAIYVTPARADNLSQFSRKEIQDLRDACNGDLELRAVAEGLLAQVTTGSERP